MGNIIRMATAGAPKSEAGASLVFIATREPQIDKVDIDKNAKAAARALWMSFSRPFSEAFLEEFKTLVDNWDSMSHQKLDELKECVKEFSVDTQSE